MVTMDFSSYPGRYVVLRTKGNLSYAGVWCGVDAPIGLRPAAIVEIDAASGFAVRCPLEFIAEVKVVPILEECAR
jgi:hypothetical protein